MMECEKLMVELEAEGMSADNVQRRLIDKSDGHIRGETEQRSLSGMGLGVSLRSTNKIIDNRQVVDKEYQKVKSIKG